MREMNNIADLWYWLQKKGGWHAGCGIVQLKGAQMVCAAADAKSQAPQ